MTHLSLVLHCSNLCVEVSTMNSPCELVDTIELENEKKNERNKKWKKYIYKWTGNGVQ